MSLACICIFFSGSSLLIVMLSVLLWRSRSSRMGEILNKPATAGATVNANSAQAIPRLSRLLSGIFRHRCDPAGIARIVAQEFSCSSVRQPFWPEQASRVDRDSHDVGVNLPGSSHQSILVLRRQNGAVHRHVMRWRRWPESLPGEASVTTVRNGIW